MKFTPKQARLFAGKTQDEMASCLKINVNTYARYEKEPENMSFSMGAKFADAVGMDIDSIIFFHSDSNLELE